MKLSIEAASRVMDHDYTKRGYLLPEGCKDLIDVLKPKPKPSLIQESPPPPPKPRPLPPLIGDIVVPPNATVLELAAILQQKPFQIIADLMEIGIFANIVDKLPFTAIQKVARRYGYNAKPS